MLATHYFLPVLSCVLLSGCEAPPAARAELALANTVWVPRTITWVRPHPNDAELSGIQYADFTLLSFQPQGRCLLISDYHSLGDADTIIVSTESPRVDSGHYQLGPHRVVIRSKNLSHYFTPPKREVRGADRYPFLDWPHPGVPRRRIPPIHKVGRAKHGLVLGVMVVLFPPFIKRSGFKLDFSPFCRRIS